MHRRSSFRAVIFAGTLYALVGIVFALPFSHGRAWRLGAWVVSGLAYAVHVGYERFRLGNTSFRTALHVGLGAALGAFGLALGAIIRTSVLSSTTSQHQRLLLIALVVWPVITGVPAFLAGLAVSALAARLSTSAGADRIPARPSKEVGLASQVERHMTIPIMARRPSAFFPVVMSVAALAVVFIHLALHGTAPQADEGTAAHLWQLLMAAQVPFIACFAIRWLPQSLKCGVAILALQGVAALGALAPVYLLRW